MTKQQIKLLKRMIKLCAKIVNNSFCCGMCPIYKESGVCSECGFTEYGIETPADEEACEKEFYRRLGLRKGSK